MISNKFKWLLVIDNLLVINSGGPGRIVILVSSKIRKDTAESDIALCCVLVFIVTG
jgi:hypothetical protein